MARTLKITLAYDGSEFAGWQVQPDRPTVQGALAEALERLTGERALPQGSGRTDAGVHALAQVASVRTASRIPALNFKRALNALLPASIRVNDVEEMPEAFHARHDARAKTYLYRVHRAEVCPPFAVRYVHHHPFPLDEGAMRAAAPGVEGRHDFTSFAAVDPERGRGEAVSNVRTIFHSSWRREGDELVYEVRGDGFLHHMVRNLVGTFLLVGKGSVPPGAIGSILEARNRAAAGPTAPASGLCLKEVEY